MSKLEQKSVGHQAESSGVAQILQSVFTQHFCCNRDALNAEYFGVNLGSGNKAKEGNMFGWLAKKIASTSVRMRLGTTPAEDIAKNLYEVFVRERCGKGFSEESNSLPIGLRSKFFAKVDLYREALLLMVLISQSESHRELEQILQAYEACIFGLAPMPSGLQKLDATKAAMADLARLLNPEANRRELAWGFEWFRGIGHDETNPVRLSLFVTTWMDDYIALVKTVQEVRLSLSAKGGQQQEPTMKANDAIPSALVYDGFDESGLTVLLEQWGLSVLRVTNGSDAERELRLRKFDLIILESWDSYVRSNIDAFTKFSAQTLFLDFEGQNKAFLSSKGFGHVLDKPIEVVKFREHVQSLLGKKTLRRLAGSSGTL